MFTKTKPKQKKDEQVISQDIIDQIPIVNHDPVILEIDKKSLVFTDLLKAKNDEFYQTSSSTPVDQPAVRTDPVKDGTFLVDGGDIESLEGPRKDDKRRDILRQLEALRKAISILQNQRRHAVKTAIKQACDFMPEQVSEVFEDVIVGAENLVEKIQRAERTNEILNDLGIDEMRRPPHLTINMYFRNICHHSPGASLPSLIYIIKNLKKIWEQEK